MELQQVQEKSNELLGRIELSGEILFTGATPSYAQLSKVISEKKGVEEQRIVIKNVFTSFGHSKAKFVAYIYKSIIEKNLFEPKIKVKKGKTGAVPEQGKEAVKA